MYSGTMPGMSNAFATPADFACARNQHAEQRLEHGRLTRSIGANQQGDFTLARVQRELVEDREARRVAGDDAFEFDDILGHH